MTTGDDESEVPARGPETDKLERLCAAIRAIDIDVLLSEEAWR
ncbi:MULTISPECIES: hypothetical protein [Mycobacterium]|uniref:Transposase n=1 Tax=Mycobacterium intracellulare subsp. chimaera TaxID=222805 RepID=A0ABT7PAX6_MYCIT|nr:MULTISPECIES: hypothetical protein [Mycobacterium]MDM3930300.1 hypothetical protein [Mycobacterium intracellulare subsp. chimaera]